ncbi:male sterility protein-domain-containing protein [Parasitella parasitica]|nr:male sterility protein-domain-containing protein [Parasitella parasitica]
MKDYYNKKTILITGATGFVGKAILWQLLKEAGTVIDKVYVLIRPKRIPAGSPSQRILDEIVNTPVFYKLLRYFDNDKEALRRKLIPISCDLSLSHMGLSMEDSIQMKDTNIVIHCAATSEYENSVEWNLETNVLGTIRLMDYLDGCDDVCSFIHMSPIHIYQDAPDDSDDTVISEYIYDIGLGDPEDFLKQLLGADEKELSALVKRILQKFSTLHLFTKALTEHLIAKRVNQVRNVENQGYPLAIFRSHFIGPAAVEPTPGWTTGMSGVSSWLALYGHSIPIIQPDQGRQYANVFPVDYVAKCIIHSIHTIKYPGPDFVAPFANNVIKRNSTAIYHPYIFNMSTSAFIKPITWCEAYTAIQDYWTRPSNVIPNNQKLPIADSYFSSNKTLSKARFLMQYYFRSSANSNSSNSGLNSVLSNGNSSFNLYNAPSRDYNQQQDQQKWMELASNIRNNLARQNRYPWEYNTTQFDALIDKLEGIDVLQDLSWHNYFMQSCHGVHVYTLHCGHHMRTSVLPSFQVCSLYSHSNTASIIDSSFKSVVYTEEEMRQRVQYMIATVISSLKNPGQFIQNEKEWKPIWIEYLNDMLEDWCDEGSIEALEISMKKKEIQTRWQLKVDENNEMTKVAVLNDPRVGKAIQQISDRSGMPVEKVMEEAMRSLNRIQERTQLPYAWFAATFLQKLFKSMFSGIYIDKASLEKIRESVKNKRVVYVPVSKTTLDPVLVWYLAIRYELPIPALVLDEALAILGPFSDLLRLAGAVFIKRDPNTRSTLTTAVTSAYLQHLMQEHGAMTLILDKVRSRTGIFQKPYQDGLVDMIIGQDVVFIPINVSYEEVPDIVLLIAQDLQTSKRKSQHNGNNNGIQRSASHRMSTPTKVSRPSESRSHRVRSRSLNGWQEEQKTKSGAEQQAMHCGRLLVGFGQPISVDGSVVGAQWADTIQKEQKRATVISPISLVASILLYSRVRGNCIDLQTMKDYLEYLRVFVKSQSIAMDWQDTETIIFYNIRLLEKTSNLVTWDERNSGFTFKISTKSESILQLAYYANQVRELFVLDSIFASTYLSFGSLTKVAEMIFIERFEFLATLFQYHFETSWNIKEEYQRLKLKYQEYMGGNEGTLERIVTKVNLSKKYNQFGLLASFIYPILDSFWVTLCALSSLNDVKALPLSLVPTLSQWIGMHLISGRRTIYSEVLSTEYNQNTLQTLVQWGLLSKKSTKLILSPDAQMLMQALGLSTNEDLIILEHESDEIAELCKKVEQLRKRDEDDSLSRYIYEKCQNQIRSLAKKSTSFSKKQGATVVEEKEEAMIQLGYALLQSMDNNATL